MIQFKEKFDTLLGVKSEPNNHEVQLFERGQKYIQKLSKVPGIEMIAIVNSLSMYATHPDSDIDLFIVTKPGIIWFVRFFSTLILWKHWVWRKNEDVAGNLCLSFFITTEAMDLSKVVIENDIYLYYWIYNLKPIIVKNNIYGKFLKINNWVKIDREQEIENQKYIIQNWTSNETTILYLYSWINKVIRFLLLRRTMKSKVKLWNPEWIVISDTMLKFHNQDKRKEIRNTIFEKNFDK
jgi:hypothetical protein